VQNVVSKHIVQQWFSNQMVFQPTIQYIMVLQPINWRTKITHIAIKAAPIRKHHNCSFAANPEPGNIDLIHLEAAAEQFGLGATAPPTWHLSLSQGVQSTHDPP